MPLTKIISVFCLVLWPMLAFSNDEVSFGEIKSIIEKNGLKSIEELLPWLPQGIRANYTLVYDSKSSQGASMLYPRVIMFGKNGRTLMAFNGHPEHKGFDSFEMIEFNKEQQKFEFREIIFPEKNSRKLSVEFSEANPARCLVCHDRSGKRDPAPFWTEYPDWPGMYGSKHDNLDKAESESLKEFKSLAQTSLRYKHLINTSNSSLAPYPETTNDVHLRNRPNSRLSIYLSHWNALRIARAIREVEDYSLRRDIFLLLQIDRKAIFGELQKKLEAREILERNSKNIIESFLSGLPLPLASWTMHFGSRVYHSFVDATNIYWNGVHWTYELVAGELAKDLMQEDERFRTLYKKEVYFTGHTEIDFDYENLSSLNDISGKYNWDNGVPKGTTKQLLLDRIETALNSRPKLGVCGLLLTAVRSLAEHL